MLTRYLLAPAKLPCLFMQGMSRTSGTIFFKFDPIRVGSSVFSSCIVSFLAVCAGQGHLDAHC